MSLPSLPRWKMLCNSRNKLSMFLYEKQDFPKGKTKGDLIIKLVQLGPQDSHLKKSFEDRYLKGLSEGNGMVLRSNREAQIFF